MDERTEKELGEIVHVAHAGCGFVGLWMLIGLVFFLFLVILIVVGIMKS
jgi:hypothetical protein